MSDEICKKISNICSFIGVVWMTYGACYNVLVYNITFPQIFLRDPISYATGFIPIIAGGVLRVWYVVREGFHGSSTVKFVCEPLTYLLFLFIDLLIIRHFEMHRGFALAFSWIFFVGFVLLLIFAVIQATVFAYLEHESIHEIFSGRTLWIAWLTLAAVNGCVEAYEYVKGYGELLQETIQMWVVVSIVLTLLYMVWIIIYLIFSVPFALFGMLE